MKPNQHDLLTGNKDNEKKVEKNKSMLKEQFMDRHVAEVRRMRKEERKMGGRGVEEREREDERVWGKIEGADAIIWEDYSTLYVSLGSGSTLSLLLFI